MMDQICNHIHNWFADETGIHAGTWTIQGGVIDLTGIVAEGQYFRIVGSALNDGVYKYPIDATDEAQALADETFTGEIWAMKVPRALRALETEIRAWLDKYGEHAMSPYQSESVVGVYSYARASGGGSGGSDGGTWQGAFRARLNPWRKLR